MRRKFVATIGNEELEISADPTADNRWRLTIGGRVHIVDAREVRPGTWSLLCDGRSYVFDLDRRGDAVALLRGTAEATAILEDAKRRKLAQAVSSRATGRARGEVICAPIAGKVVEILVTPGQEVAAEQSVGVLEAMKMENEIKAERGGTVEVVHVAAGDSVETGDRLVTLR